MPVKMQGKDFARRYRFAIYLTSELEVEVLEALLRINGAFSPEGPQPISCSSCTIHEEGENRTVHLTAPVDLNEGLALRHLRDSLTVGVNPSVLLACQMSTCDGAVRGFFQLTPLSRASWSIGPWDANRNENLEESLVLRYGRLDYRP